MTWRDWGHVFGIVLGVLLAARGYVWLMESLPPQPIPTQTQTIREISTGRIVGVVRGEVVDVDGRFSVGRTEDWEAKQ